ncbi:MAG: hypothetical protein HY860_06445 [Chlamydiales bacterium]|nr:hypothetical protein [Chlamydiales bacterium]
MLPLNLNTQTPIIPQVEKDSCISSTIIKLSIIAITTITALGLLFIVPFALGATLSVGALFIGAVAFALTYCCDDAYTLPGNTGASFTHRTVSPISTSHLSRLPPPVQASTLIQGPSYYGTHVAHMALHDTVGSRRRIPPQPDVILDMGSLPPPPQSFAIPVPYRYMGAYPQTPVTSPIQRSSAMTPAPPGMSPFSSSTMTDRSPMKSPPPPLRIPHTFPVSPHSVTMDPSETRQGVGSRPPMGSSMGLPPPPQTS